jgi:hypothetical protein
MLIQKFTRNMMTGWGLNNLAENKDKWQACLNMIMKIAFQFLSRLRNYKLLKRAVLRGFI